MKTFSNHFFINGKALFDPDENMSISYSDDASSDSGMDESGYYHRVVVRYNRGRWDFVYSHITEREKNYIESLFPAAPDFEFSHPDRLNSSKIIKTRAYRDKCNLAWKNAATGMWRNYKFSIIEC